MKWEDYKRMEEEKSEYPNYIKTHVECPKCGMYIYKRTDIVLTSYPAQYQYECKLCGWVGYAPK